MSLFDFLPPCLLNCCTVKADTLEEIGDTNSGLQPSLAKISKYHHFEYRTRPRAAFSPYHSVNRSLSNMVKFSVEEDFLDHIFNRHVSKDSTHYSYLIENARKTNSKGGNWTVFEKKTTEQEARRFIFNLLKNAEEPVQERTYGNKMETIATMGYQIGTRPLFSNGQPVDNPLTYYKVVSVRNNRGGYTCKTIFPL